MIFKFLNNSQPHVGLVRDHNAGLEQIQVLLCDLWIDEKEERRREGRERT
jgi:hypothetical protein